jgi:mRNA-degrading endonuclease RelE of RelBE toxin-antitoxin system
MNVEMEIRFFRQAHRFIKKADTPLKEKLKEEILKIRDNPTIGELLTGKLKYLRAHHFNFIRTQYRLAYTVEKNLIIIAIGTRENFYRDLLN